jgi:hypothetical protein
MKLTKNNTKCRDRIRCVFIRHITKIEFCFSDTRISDNQNCEFYQQNKIWEIWFDCFCMFDWGKEKESVFSVCVCLVCVCVCV